MIWCRAYATGDAQTIAFTDRLSAVDTEVGGLRDDVSELTMDVAQVQTDGAQLKGAALRPEPTKEPPCSSSNRNRQDSAEKERLLRVRSHE